MAADLELIGAVRAALRGAAQPELAGLMQAYTKSATPYLGVRVPAVRDPSLLETLRELIVTGAWWDYVD